MVGIDLFSKRQKLARGEMPDVYHYDELPDKLRVQILHIISDAFGVDALGKNNAQAAYRFVQGQLCRELGVFELVEFLDSDKEQIFEYFRRETSVEFALDVVELCFRAIELQLQVRDYGRDTIREIQPQDAIELLNARFKESGVGYQYVSGQIIRIDSEFLHTEAVRPTLAVLGDENFRGANEEFLRAHEHYRHGRNEECMVEALKAFESTMKIICSLNNWSIKTPSTARNLILACSENGLFPNYLKAQLTSVRSLLESGVPTLRNKNAAHGQGNAVINVPGSLASL
ncbi:MAG: hypothetical protein GX799_09785 [Crenarchaeota archaeon]|jgi:hypothetical protein|nr:hypothetical protein [Thermoproteota archaeon]